MESEEALRVFRASPHAILPKRAESGSAGYDLASASLETLVVPAHGKLLVSTDLVFAIPSGTYGRIAPRSGIANKNFIDVGAGVVDESYRGIVRVLLFNHDDKDFIINHKDRIAQLILEKIKTPPVVEFDSVESLGTTERGEGGFGSTGVSSS